MICCISDTLKMKDPLNDSADGLKQGLLLANTNNPESTTTGSDSTKKFDLDNFVGVPQREHVPRKSSTSRYSSAAVNYVDQKSVQKPWTLFPQSKNTKSGQSRQEDKWLMTLKRLCLIPPLIFLILAILLNPSHGSALIRDMVYITFWVVAIWEFWIFFKLLSQPVHGYHMRNEQVRRLMMIFHRFCQYRSVFLICLISLLFTYMLTQYIQNIPVFIRCYRGDVHSFPSGLRKE